MGFFEYANDKVKKLSWIDFKLVGIAGLFIGIILVKYFPSLLDINIWWYAILALLSLAKVYYVIFFKKSVV